MRPHPYHAAARDLILDALHRLDPALPARLDERLSQPGSIDTLALAERWEALSTAERQEEATEIARDLAAEAQAEARGDGTR